MKSALKTARKFNSLVGLLYVVMFLAVGIVTVVTLMDSYADSIMKESIRRRMESSELNVTIARLDETLTMSARMAAATGDRQWEERYLHFDPILENAIKSAIRLHPRQYAQAGARQIDEANRKLVALEKRSLELARNHRLAEAAGILNSPEYLAHKHVYSEGIQRFISAIRKESEDSHESSSAVMRVRLALLVPGILLFIVCVFVMQQGKKLLNQHIAAETALLQFNEKLQVMVEERTLSLHEAKEEAEQANRLKSEFLANVTHELKTPVHCIMNYAQLGVSSCEQKEPALVREYFDDIFANSQRLDLLISDLLSFTKIEAGSLDFRLDMHSVRRLVDNAVTGVRALLEEKRLKLEMEGEWSESVIVDANRMEQILVNLMSNAIRFSPDGGRIVWRCDISEMPICDSRLMNPALLLTISDEGPGIPPEELDSIFDKFIQGRSGILKGGGTGLGLSICRSLLKTFHGSIRALNAPPGGAMFEIVLPMWHKAKFNTNLEKTHVKNSCG